MGWTSDDAERAVGSVGIWGAGGQPRGVFVAHSVEGAEVMLGSVRFHFQVVGDGVASWPVAKDHLIFAVFKLETLQHAL